MSVRMQHRGGASATYPHGGTARRHTVIADAEIATVPSAGARPSAWVPEAARVWAARVWPVAGVVLSILLYSLACPPYEWAILAWAAPGLLLVPTRDLRLRHGLACGFLFGALFGLWITLWTFHATLSYFEFDRFRAGAFVVVMWLTYAGIPYGLLIVSYGAAARVTPVAWLAPVGAWFWVASEWLRSTMLTGLPWELLGDTQFRHLTLIQVADLGGVYAVSFVLALCSLAVAEVVREFLCHKRRPADLGVRLGVPAAVLLAVLVYGVHAERLYATPGDGPTRTIAVVQARMPTEFRWKRAFFSRAVARYGQLTQAAGNAALDLVVWPENAVNFYIAEEPMLASQLGIIAARATEGLLVGGPRFGPTGLAHNSAYLLSPSGGIRDTYDKVRLVPFAEYDPFRRVRATEGDPDTYAPGAEVRPIHAGSMTLGTTICYEALFPHLVRELVRRGADVLVNISNDAWLDHGDGTAPRQHFSQVIFRAIENRRYMVRASDSGVSGFISPAGHIYSIVADGIEGSAVDRVVPMNGQTPYGRWGDGWIALGGCLIGAGLLRRARGRV